VSDVCPTNTDPLSPSRSAAKSGCGSSARVLLLGSRLVMLEGGGHFPQEDAPDAVTRELNAFLTAVQ